MTLGLGTAQLGSEYGISPREGRIPSAEIDEILRRAAEAGILLIDTSPCYGNSEEVLGSAIAAGDPFRIVTKTAPGVSSSGALADDLRLSLAKLRRQSVYGLLVHRAEDLLQHGGARIYSELVRLKREGVVEKIGVSVYNADEIDLVIDRFEIDLVQVPVSVLDQRLLASGHLTKLKHLGIEIHSRSTFLQGALLMGPDKLPPRLQPLSGAIGAYRSFIAAKGMSPAAGAVGFSQSIPEIDVVLCGINSLDQLIEIARSAEQRVNLEEFHQFGVTDVAVLDPSRW